MRLKGHTAALSLLLVVAWCGASLGQSMPDDDAAEVALWQTVQSSRRAADFESFLLLYPRGRFAALARIRLGRLGVPAVQTAPAAETDADTDQAAAPDPGLPQLYHLDITPHVLGMGQTATIKCRGFMPPALYDRIVVVPVGTPDFTAAGKVDERRLLWNGLANLYDCSGAGIGLPMMLKGSYEVRYLSRQYNPDGTLEVVARSGFVYR